MTVPYPPKGWREFWKFMNSRSRLSYAVRMISFSSIIIVIGFALLIAYFFFGYRIIGGVPGIEFAFATGFLFIGISGLIGGVHYRRKWMRTK